MVVDNFTIQTESYKKEFWDKAMRGVRGADHILAGGNAGNQTQLHSMM